MGSKTTRMGLSEETEMSDLRKTVKEMKEEKKRE